MYWTCGQCCVFRKWMMGSNHSDRIVRTGHVVSVVCYVDYVGVMF